MFNKIYIKSRTPTTNGSGGVLATVVLSLSHTTISALFNWPVNFTDATGCQLCLAEITQCNVFHWQKYQIFNNTIHDISDKIIRYWHINAKLMPKLCLPKIVKLPNYNFCNTSATAPVLLLLLARKWARPESSSFACFADVTVKRVKMFVLKLSVSQCSAFFNALSHLCACADALNLRREATSLRRRRHRWRHRRRRVTWRPGSSSRSRCGAAAVGRGGWSASRRSVPARWRWSRSASTATDAATRDRTTSTPSWRSTSVSVTRASVLGLGLGLGLGPGAKFRVKTSTPSCQWTATCRQTRAVRRRYWANATADLSLRRCRTAQPPVAARESCTSDTAFAFD